MFQTTLNAANIANCLAVLGQAIADVSVTGGVGAVISGAVSGHALLADLSSAEKRAARKMAADIAAKLNTSHLTEERKETTAKLLAENMPTEPDLLVGNMSAPDIAAAMAAKLAAEPQAKQDYQDILQTILSPHVMPQDKMELMQQETLKRLSALQEQMNATGGTDRLREAGITETAIIELAQRIAGDTEDLGQAWRELQNAMEIAVDFQREGRTKSNHPDFVDEVLARAAELAAEGEYDDAWETIQKARVERREAYAAQEAKFLESAENIARLDRNPERVAEAIIARADLRNLGKADLNALRVIFLQLRQIGLDKGLLFEQRIAIALSEASMERATSADERGYVLNDIAETCRELGERESDTSDLLKSVENHKLALEKRTRDRVPLDWAMTQNNLGNALQRLGEREIGTARLEEAITAYQNALKEWTRGRVPLKWAMTQNNLGSALHTLGQRESGTARLEEAVTAFRNALKEWDQDRVPLDWAMTQNNLGNALRSLGERETDTSRLEQAVTAFQNALKEWTRDRVPLDWAMTQGNLTNVELAFFDKTDDPKHLSAAREYLANAMEVFQEAGATHYIAVAEKQAAQIDARAKP
ncbi:MAG: tetratricopeptide repeat protein [Pseudomonadota bacterium]